ncbi:phage holin family protein [Actinacidiphila yeochonensis]|uniref:phage holin family protein n=1 Tax=Actinacidiphila yeochonensis TaxID=89050 RepID=UPI00056961A3|nr:phage holin family protein [Actinacidiphila yeochonensis]
MAYANGSRSVGTLVKEGTEQLSDLVRQEMKLAQAELAQKGKRAGIGGGMFGAAGLMGFFALAALVTAAVAALAIPLSLWLAALTVAAGLLIIAGIAALLGRHKVKQAVPPMPEGTMDNVHRDLVVLKERAKR